MTVTSSNYKRLIETVLEYSDATEWHAAVLEWCIDDVEEDVSQAESCICGKENLRYLFTIRNTINGHTLYPIGSSCIKKFERSDLDEEIAVKEQLFKLLHAIDDNCFLTLSSNFFSRKLLRYLYDSGAFKASSYNNSKPYDDYQFMLDMFNKHTRSERQEKKATAIILNSIKPFLQNMLSGKIH
ncbi:MAG TPA: hypothetical protein DD733_12265 [Clostridiales bacterium]|nr:hypothetical protein [Clostridiales bacterium]